MSSSKVIKRFKDAAAPPSAHRSDKRSEVNVFRITGSKTGLRLEPVSFRNLVTRAARGCVEDRAEASPALKAQIKESFEAHMRGDSRHIDEFLAELEAELSEQ